MRREVRLDLHPQNPTTNPAAGRLGATLLLSFFMRAHPEYLARAGGGYSRTSPRCAVCSSCMPQGNTDGSACCLGIALDDVVIGLVELFRL